MRIKKIVIIVAIVSLFAAPVFAGDIAAIIGFDTLIGAAGGAGLGTAFSLPSFFDGQSKQPEVLAVGAGWGAIIGGSIGFIYSFFHLSYHMEVRQKRAVEQKKSSINLDLPSIRPYNIGLQVSKNF
ncbi:MAG TPA: hypothetical protein ENN43_05775 [bacterium]|nr:hypothetical protein [bacterium]